MNPVPTQALCVALLLAAPALADHPERWTCNSPGQITTPVVGPVSMVGRVRGTLTGGSGGLRKASFELARPSHIGIAGGSVADRLPKQPQPNPMASI